MTWRSFMDYWLMRELGQLDAICRNYRLDNPTHNDNHNFCYSALARMDIHVQKGDYYYAVHEVRQRLVNMGCSSADADFNKVRTRLNEWYIWDRTRTGERRKGPYVKRDNPLLD